MVHIYAMFILCLSSITSVAITSGALGDSKPRRFTLNRKSEARCGVIFKKSPAVHACLLAGCRSGIAVTDNAPYAGYWRLVFNKSSYELFQPFLTTCA